MALATKPLTVRRAADRAVIADRLAAVATAAGASVERTDAGRCILLMIRLGDVSLSIDLDGDFPHPDEHMLSWCIWPRLAHGQAGPALAEAMAAAPRFAATFAPDVNEFHRHKATDIAHGAESLVAILQKRLASIADRTAFQPNPEGKPS